MIDTKIKNLANEIFIIVSDRGETGLIGEICTVEKKDDEYLIRVIKTNYSYLIQHNFHVKCFTFETHPEYFL